MYVCVNMYIYIYTHNTQYFQTSIVVNLIRPRRLRHAGGDQDLCPIVDLISIIIIVIAILTIIAIITIIIIITMIISINSIIVMSILSINTLRSMRARVHNLRMHTYATQVASTPGTKPSCMCVYVCVYMCVCIYIYIYI